MEITKWVPVEKGNLLGFASIKFSIPTLGMFYINGIGVCQKNSTRWLNMPNKPYEVDGVKKYQNYCGFEARESQDRLSAAFFKEFDEYIKKYKPSGTMNGQSKTNYEEELPF